MIEKMFKVGKEGAHKRLDQFLADALKEKASRSQIQKIILSGWVLVNGRSEKSHYKIKDKDVINVSFQKKEEGLPAPENIPVEIIYQDQDIIVVNKPPGMVVHPAAGNLSGTLVNALVYKCKKLSNLGAPHRPGIVHRLDKDTSGLLVVAKTDKAYSSLVDQFKKRTVKKIYKALVKGKVEHDEGIIDLPIGRHPRRRQEMAVTFVRSKKAQTGYKVLKRYKDYTFVEIKLGTGRTHQIRVHMANIGNPILGDRKYGTHHEIGRSALHAAVLGFAHPRTGKYVQFESPVPEDINRLL